MGRLTEAASQVSPLYRTVGAIYVVGVSATAALGFITDSTPPILLAALLSLPASVIALPGYYMAYGLLAQFPGANPSVSSSSKATCTVDGVCSRTTTGEQAAWFLVTTEVLGVLALTCAALVNVIALWVLTARHRRARNA